MRCIVYALFFLLSSVVAQANEDVVDNAAQDPFPHLTLLTENYPPFNMVARNHEITGISTDIIRQLMERNQLSYDIDLLPWNRAYSAAQSDANTGVYSTTRTQEREKLFKWVGPLMENRWVFLSKESRNITISSLEEAKKYRIGVTSGDAAAIFLQEQGFELDLVRRDELNAHKLARGRIDLWATGHLLGPYLAKQERVGPVKEVLTFRSIVMALAFHPDTPDHVIDLLNADLEKMHNDGSIEHIEAKYR